MELMEQLDAFSSLSTQMRKEMENTLKSERTRAESLQRQVVQTAIKAEEELKSLQSVIESKNQHIQTRETEFKNFKAQVQVIQNQLKAKHTETQHYQKVITQLQSSLREANESKAKLAQAEKRIAALETMLKEASSSQLKIERIESKIDLMARESISKESMNRVESATQAIARAMNQIESITRQTFTQTISEIQKVGTESTNAKNRVEMNSAQTMLQMNSGFKMLEKQVQTVMNSLQTIQTSTLRTQVEAQMVGRSIGTQIENQIETKINASQSRANEAATMESAEGQIRREMPNREVARLKRENEMLKQSQTKALEEIQLLRKDFNMLQESSIAEIDRLREREQGLREQMTDVFGEESNSNAAGIA